MSKKLFLLDGHSLAHRAFYALPLLQNSDGEFTNAVFGFARMLFKLIDDEQPDLMLVAFDKKAPTFRHEEYDQYKAHRKKMPDELRPQIPLIKELLTALKVPIYSKEGYEADDLIGTLAKKGEGQGYQVRIVTGDRDSLQLVSEKTNVIYTRKGITDIVKYDLAEVQEKYELTPEQLIDMKGLMGDSSDNIPGVPGIGEKTAISLLKEFSTLENVLDNIDQVSGKKRKENLREYTEQARLSKRLATIMLDVPLEVDFQECQMEEPEEEEIVYLLERLEFSSLLDRFQQGKKMSKEEIVLKQIKEKKDISLLINKLSQERKIVFDILIDDYQRPVSAQLKSLIVALNEDEIYQVDFSGDNPQTYIKEVIGLFKPIMQDHDIKKDILHAKEVMIVLRRYGIQLAGLEFDPLLAAYLINPSDTLPSLEELLKNELNLVLPDDLSIEKQTAISVASMYAIKERLYDKLKKTDLMKLYQEMEIPLIKVLGLMEFNGIKVDQSYLQHLSEKWQGELETITNSIYQLAEEQFNINSPKQLGEILFEKLGLPVIKRTKTTYSTSIQVLEELVDKHDIIPLIMEYRQLTKLKSTYVDALPPLINSATERVHTSLNQMVTATGRLSSTDPNLQNIPIRTEEGREIRKAFVPEGEDYVLLAADYSQIELRVLAHISKDKNLTAAFKEGQDIHTQTASEVFAVAAKHVTSNMRRQAKVINFGIAYGMSPYGLAQDLNIPRKEAEEYINRYFERFAGVKEYMDRVIEQAKSEGYITTIFQRRRYIPEIRSRNYHRRAFAERTAINSPIQGSAADIMKLAMIRVYDRLQLEKVQARMLLQVHDELVLEVHRDDLNTLAHLVKTEMEAAAQLKVPLIADLQVGENWKEKKDYIL